MTIMAELETNLGKAWSSHLQREYDDIRTLRIEVVQGCMALHDGEDCVLIFPEWANQVVEAIQAWQKKGGDAT
jgi:hypothetical protein